MILKYVDVANYKVIDRCNIVFVKKYLQDKSGFVKIGSREVTSAIHITE